MICEIVDKRTRGAIMIYSKILYFERRESYEMKKTGKFTAVFLSLLLLVSVFSFASSAATGSDFSYTVNADKTTCTLTGYSGSETELAIPETIDGYTVTALGQALFAFKRGPEAITIPKTVTSYNNPYTFSFSQILKSVTVAEDNPVFSSAEGVLFNKDKTILEYYPIAREAQSYTVPEGVQTIANYAFEDALLVSVKLPSTLKSIGNYAFSHCVELTEIVIPEGTEKVGASAFRNCEAMKSAYIPDSAADLGVALFYSSAALESIRLPKGIQKIPNSMVYECVALKEFTIPDTVTEIGMQAFHSCKALEKITIPESVQTIGANAFSRGANVTVYGISDSYAQTYAQENGFTFVALDAPIVLTPNRNAGDTIIKTDTLTETGESGENFIVTVPAETVIPWGTLSTNLCYTVESHLGYRKALSVLVSGHGMMTCVPETDVLLSLPYTLTGETVFKGASPVMYPAAEKIFAIQIDEAAWANAPVEEYADILTFTSEVIR